MKFKSEAHRKKMKELVKQGKLSQEKFDQFEKETGAAQLPDRVKPKKHK